MRFSSVWKQPLPKRLSISEYRTGVLNGKRSVLARAITLVESQRYEDQQLAQQLMQEILPYTGASIRIGISGLPGVGKSSLLDTLGMILINKGLRIAILAIDPSSNMGGGSILGDKTRMHRLAIQPKAYIRPSASGKNLGGVAKKTREAMLLCEAAGFDVIIIETVGVGQSEVEVSNMVDCFLALMLPGGGDELQGIKKGVLERADIIVINKADADRMPLARATLREHRAALGYLRRRHQEWKPIAMMTSAITGLGIDELWETICQHNTQLRASGALQNLRSDQQALWMWNMVEEGLKQKFLIHPAIQNQRVLLEANVREGKTSATQAAQYLLSLFFNNHQELSNMASEQITNTHRKSVKKEP